MPGPSQETRRKPGHCLISLGLLAVLTLVLFGDALFGSQHLVLSSPDGDLLQQFLPWRAFGFGELRHGNLALWNPHLFSGAPFFGGFQPALLYPPNALFLWLPLDKAVNWSIALHVFLAGAFTFAWAAKRGLRWPACLLAGVIFMFCGAHFLHIYAGHLPNLCTLVWAPLVFLAIDGLIETPSLGWSLLGMFALAMQVLAGHPQYCFYTGLAAALYCAMNLFQTQRPGRFALGVAGILAGGLALSAVQWLTGLQETRESVRGPGVPYGFAATFSFPPENFLTLVAPDFFGDMKTLLYWGRCYWWEMSLFIGVSGLVLAIVGAVWGDRRSRRFSVVMVAMLLLLALGSHTPLFGLLYHWVPGFDKFRGNSKYIFLASLFLAMLAGVGFNHLLAGHRPTRLLVAGTAAGGLMLLAAAGALGRPGLWIAADHGWQSVLTSARNSSETYVAPQFYKDPAFAGQSRHMASQSLLIGGATLAVVAMLLGCLRKYPVAIWLLLGVAVAELFLFARNSLDSFDARLSVDPDFKQFLDGHPGDFRVLNPAEPNAAMNLGRFEVWGHDPAILRRYAEVLALSQQVDPDSANLNLPFTRDHPLLDLFRCRFVFVQEADGLTVHERTNGLPHVLLVQAYRVLEGRAQIFTALTDDAFDPRREVILESKPDPEPAATNVAGIVRLTNVSTDEMTIEADLQSPGILLITDSYAKGWRARALAGSVQSSYQVMPADYCLRAVPLSAGRHLLRLEYMPAGFILGRWITIISSAAFLMLTGWQWKGKSRSGCASLL